MTHYVDFSNERITIVSNRDLEQYKNNAIANQNEGGKARYRYCLHDAPENELHEMIICVTKDDYFRPHKHEGGTESHYIVEGRSLIIFFDEEGSVIKHTILGKQKNDSFAVRIEPNIYHMNIPLSDTVIFYEVKKGPFVSDSNTYAKWAPENFEETFIENILDKTIRKG